MGTLIVKTGKTIFDQARPLFTYSLRKLSTGYKGQAIRVRRSSDNAELDIGFLGRNLDTNSLLSFVGSGSGFVTTWYNQSGWGGNLIQPEVARQPSMVINGVVNNENGTPAVSFDYINDLMYWDIDRLVCQTRFVCYAVARFTNVQQALVNLGGGGKGAAIFTETGGVRLRHIYVSPTTDASVPNTTLQSLYYGEFSDSVSRLEANANLADDGLVQQYTLNPPLIGALLGVGALSKTGGYRMGGTIQELILYEDDYSSYKAGIKQNINNHYSIY